MAYTAYRVKLYLCHGAHQTAISGYSGFPHLRFSHVHECMHAAWWYIFKWKDIAGMGICMQQDSLLWQPMLLHMHAQAEKQGMVARPQVQQTVGRCRDGENVLKVSAC